MFGLNKIINIYETHRSFSNTGSIEDENEELIFSGVRVAIQPHILNNLPPPSDRPTLAGIFYQREFRCWIPKATVATAPRTTWIIENASTEEKFRVRAVIDDAGRDHHWLVRMENYDG